MENHEETPLRRHPTKDITGALSNRLGGKTICLCLTGSVGIVNSPSIARGLMRHGAEVIPVMSKEAIDLLQPELMHWSTGNQVITDISGKIEHIAMAGERENTKGTADMVLIAPVTANTIGKIAHGISDSPITAISMVALGSKTPIVMVPAMHDSMFRNPIVQRNIEQLKEVGVTFLGPRLEDNKAKVAEPEEVVNYVVDFFSPTKRLEGKTFLITAGPSREWIDPVRFLSNPATGKMGIALAREVIHQGGTATIVLGPTNEKPPQGATTIRVSSTQDFLDAVSEELQGGKYNCLISSAAIGDFRPLARQPEKISSDMQELTLRLGPTKKLINMARELDPKLFIVAFKAESVEKSEDLIDRAFHRLETSKANLIVANNVNPQLANQGFGADSNEVFIIDAQKSVYHLPLCPKAEIAAGIIDYMANNQLV